MLGQCALLRVEGCFSDQAIKGASWAWPVPTFAKPQNGQELVESKVNLMSEARLASEARWASAVRLVSKALMASRGAFWCLRRLLSSQKFSQACQ